LDEEDRLEFLGQVAAWYYEDDMDQAEIAKRIGKSRSMVSRLLTEAREAGLVQIRVRFPLRTDHGLSDELRDAFGLDEAHVLGDGGDVDTVLRRLGRLGARALQGRLRSNMTVTVGWGASLHSMVRGMPEIQMQDVMVLQVMGSVGDGDPNVDGADLARSLSGKLNGDFRSIAAPLIDDRPEVAASLLADRTISTTLDMASRSDVAVTGIGSIDSELSGLVRAGYFDPSAIAHLRDLGVVGDLMGFLVDDHGRVCEIPENDRVVALHPDRLAGIGTVIGVAGGPGKSAAINAVLRGRHLDVLVTDAVSARAVLAMHGSTELMSDGLMEVSR
jgi:DNA-binding transcriptional regulator LsrR (DeoR family)